MFDQEILHRELRTALALKADDLFFTLGGSRGRKVRADFLGVAPFEGLACEVFGGTHADAIDLSQFDISRQVEHLITIVNGRLWGPKGNIPDTEDPRVYSLDFLEHFIATLPSVALGGLDATSVRGGALRALYLTSLAWLNLADAVGDTFRDEPDLHSIELSHLALLSGRDLRTIRNYAGPSKALRTTAERQQRRTSEIGTAAFVTVHTFDAIDWLRRKGFEFPAISTDWALQRIVETSKRVTIARSLIMLALINLGSRDFIASTLGCGQDRFRSLEDGLTSLTSDDERRLRHALAA